MCTAFSCIPSVMSFSSAPLVPYWDRNKLIVEREGWPECLEDWVDCQDSESKGLGQAILSTRLRSFEMNTVMDTRLANNTHVIIRVSRPVAGDVDEQWKLQRFSGEVGIMKFLRTVSTVPVPEVYLVHPASDDEPVNFIVMQHMPGNILLNSFGLLDTKGKLFDIEVPQKIGGTLPGEADDLTVVPLISYAEANYTCERVFCHEVFSSLEDYVDFLFANKRQWIDRQAISDHDKTRHHNILSMLQSRASSAMQSISSPSLRRCVLSSSPPWLVYDGPLSPEFAWEGIIWLDSPVEGARLNSVFEEYVRSKNGDYYEALVKGKELRDIVAWLNDVYPATVERLCRWLDFRYGA
ncbi:hypothetical protein CPB85DRAFT_1457893 [Mucidula mucida]|nr:hypothetical protein CPB85DRAFT_1457893 [Mucidula mucida]